MGAKARHFAVPEAVAVPHARAPCPPSHDMVWRQVMVHEQGAHARVAAYGAVRTSPTMPQAPQPVLATMQ